MTQANSVKLADFGISRINSSDDSNSLTSKIGTPSYMSQEIIKGNDYDQKTDIW